MRQPHRATAFVGVAVLLVLGGVTLAGPLAYRDDALLASLEVAIALAALLAGLLALARFVERGRAGELALGAALLALALSGIVAGILPVFVSEESASQLAWTRVPAVLFAAAALAAAPLLLRRVLSRRAPHVAAAILLACAVQLPETPAVDALAARLAAGTPDRLGDGLLLGAHALVVCLYAAAAFGLMRAGTREDDRLVRWIGLGCGLAALAHVHYAVHPSLYAEVISAGDVVRLAFSACLLVGTVREVAEHQRSLALAAVAEERRRLARELHDGLAQELAFLVTQSRLLTRRHGELDGLDALERTSLRALDESRLAIAALTRPGSEPLDVVLESVVQDFAERMGTNVRLRLAPGPHVEPALRDAVVRIVQEALTNAVRHGHAESVSVELDNGSGLRVRVDDDGRGFTPDPAARPGAGSGFGLVSMRERAEALGGRVTVASRPGRGTRVELVVP